MHGKKRIRRIVGETERKGDNLQFDKIFGVSEEDVNKEGDETKKQLDRIERLVRKGKKGHVGSAIDIFDRILHIDPTPDQLLRMSLVIYILKQNARQSVIDSIAEQFSSSLPEGDADVSVTKEDAVDPSGYA